MAFQFLWRGEEVASEPHLFRSYLGLFFGPELRSEILTSSTQLLTMPTYNIELFYAYSMNLNAFLLNRFGSSLLTRWFLSL